MEEFKFDDFSSPDFKVDFNLSEFDIIEGEEDMIENKYIKPKIFRGSATSKVKFENARDLAIETRLNPKERYDVLVAGNFIFGDFIEAYFVYNQVHTKRLVLSTLSMSQNNIDSLKTLLLKGYVDRIDLVISHYFYSMEKHNLIPYMYKELNYNNTFQSAIAFTHTKVVMAELNTGQKIVINGSANLRSSGNIETFTIEDNSEVYDFHLSYHDDILEKYATIQKHDKRKDLWKNIKD